jgi:quercetin dioxygenase-like cupin family protein
MNRLTRKMRLALAAGLCAGSVFCLVSFSNTAGATPAVGVTSTVLAQGRLDAFDTGKIKTGDWEADIRTKGVSDLRVVEHRVDPGGTFGWHSHPGPSLVAVKSGTLTLYMAHDPNCTPRVVPAGSSFVDAGNMVHVARNEGTVELVVVQTALVPAGAPGRIDEPKPGNCAF